MDYYYLLKRIKAKNLKSAMKNESRADLVSVYKGDEEDEEEKKEIKGFKNPTD